MGQKEPVRAGGRRLFYYGEVMVADIECAVFEVDGLRHVDVGVLGPHVEGDRDGLRGVVDLDGVEEHGASGESVTFQAWIETC